MASRLPARHQRFVDEFLIDLNQTQAAIRAGYSAKSARVQGNRLRNIPAVAEAIETAIRDRAARTQITQDRILDELAVVAFSNVTDYVIDDSGTVSPKPAARLDALRAISSLKRKQWTDKDGTVTAEVELRLWDKVAALKMAGQHLGMFVEREPFLNPLDVARAVRDAIRTMNAVDGFDAAA